MGSAGAVHEIFAFSRFLVTITLVGAEGTVEVVNYIAVVPALGDVREAAV